MSVNKTLGAITEATRSHRPDCDCHGCDLRRGLVSAYGRGPTRFLCGLIERWIAKQGATRCTTSAEPASSP